MKLPRLALAVIFGWLATFAVAPAAADSSRVYELRTYTATPGNGAAVVARFRNHTVKLFEKHGMVNVGYWVPTDEKDGAADKLIYLLEHKSRAATISGNSRTLLGGGRRAVAAVWPERR